MYLSVSMEATERLGWATGQVEASGRKSALRRASDSAGRNASEAQAGLESEVVDADPPVYRASRGISLLWRDL
jgi:hypothetical protein